MVCFASISFSACILPDFVKQKVSCSEQGDADNADISAGTPRTIFWRSRYPTARSAHPSSPVPPASSNRPRFPIPSGAARYNRYTAALDRPVRMRAPGLTDPSASAPDPGQIFRDRDDFEDRSLCQTRPPMACGFVPAGEIHPDMPRKGLQPLPALLTPRDSPWDRAAPWDGCRRYPQCPGT